MIKWSNLSHKTFKEDPSDAEVSSHKLLIRAGLVKKLGSGLYSYGFIFLKAMRKVESITVSYTHLTLPTILLV